MKWLIEKMTCKESLFFHACEWLGGSLRFAGVVLCWLGMHSLAHATLTCTGSPNLNDACSVTFTTPAEVDYTVKYLGADYAGAADGAVGVGTVGGKSNLFFAGNQTTTNQDGGVAKGAAMLQSLTLCNYCAVEVNSEIYLRSKSANGVNADSATNEQYLWLGPDDSTAPPSNIPVAAKGIRVGGYNPAGGIAVHDLGDDVQAARQIINTTDTKFTAARGTWFTNTIMVQRRDSQSFLLGGTQNGQALTTISHLAISQVSGYSAAWLTTGFRVGLSTDDYASQLGYRIIKPQLTITQTTSDTVAVPGQPVTFQIRVENTGEVPVAGFSINWSGGAGHFSSANWTCVGTGGASCPASSGRVAGTQAITSANIVPVDGVLTYTVTALVAPRPSELVTGTASLVMDDAVFCAASVCSATNSLPVVPVLTVSKTTTATSFVAGQNVNFTITVSNVGGTQATGVSISDPVPSGLTNQQWSCTSGCTTGLTSGAVNLSNLNIPAGVSVVLDLTATVVTPAPASVDNMVTVGPGNGVCDLLTTCSVTVSITGTPALRILKQANTVGAFVGDEVSFTLGVLNASSVPLTGVTITDAHLPGLSTYTWTCTPYGGVACPAASGTGPVSVSGLNLPGQSGLLYSLKALVTSMPPSGQLNNVLTVNSTQTTPAPVCAATGRAPPCITNAAITVLVPTPESIPTLSAWMLLSLALMLGGAGVVAHHIDRNRTQRRYS